jgi:exosortase/archaeosortase family protein
MARLAEPASVCGGGVMHPLLTCVLVMLALWDGWRWYFARVWAAPEEAASLAITMAVLGGIGATRKCRLGSPASVPLITVATALAIYAGSYAGLPPIGRAAIAIATTLFCFYVAAFGERPPVAFWGLVALALPVVPSLQFMLGYPMRIVSAALAAHLLQAQGIAVARRGTFLVWRDDMLQFDAPCSGVNMLWAGLLLTLMGCVWLRLGVMKVMIAVGLSVALAIGSNVLRASSLFYVEAGLIAQAPAWWHEGIGIAAFILSAVITLRLLAGLGDRDGLAWVR